MASRRHILVLITMVACLLFAGIAAADPVNAGETKPDVVEGSIGSGSTPVVGPGLIPSLGDVLVSITDLFFGETQDEGVTVTTTPATPTPGGDGGTFGGSDWASGPWG